MYKILRIIFCVLCAILLAVCIPVFALFDWYWGVVTLISALIFFLLMLMFKGLQGDYERAHPSAVKETRAEQPEKTETAGGEETHSNETAGGANEQPTDKNETTK